MDMLEIGTGTMNEYEEQTHFSFWAALKSPLIIGADITNIAESSLAILLNEEIIAISQDEAGIAANYLPDLSTEGLVQIWEGPLGADASSHVILALNEGENDTNITISWNSIPQLQTKTIAGYKVRDVWGAKDLGTFQTEITLANVSSHQTVVLTLSGV
jgi:alpha-galactosidase